MTAPKGRKAARRADTGVFVKMTYAKNHPKTTVVEIIKKPVQKRK